MLNYNPPAFTLGRMSRSIRRGLSHIVFCYLGLGCLIGWFTPFKVREWTWFYRGRLYLVTDDTEYVGEDEDGPDYELVMSVTQIPVRYVLGFRVPETRRSRSRDHQAWRVRPI